METKEFLKQMSNFPHVAGYESALAKFVTEKFSQYSNVTEDKFGNVIAHMEGTNGGPKVMLAAHMDEIGMMVSAVCDNGFVKFSPVGGIDKRNMLAQEVTIHGRQKVYGVIGIKPPHLTSAAERKKSVEIYDMTIDTGISSKEELEKLIRPGDIITLNQDIAELQNGKLTGKALDNTTGIAALYCAMKHLQYFSHKADLYFVATAQEEVGLRGAKTAAYTIKPDIAIAVDVGHGRAPGMPEHETIELGKGPAIAIGPHINRGLFSDLKKVASKNNAKYQVEVLPQRTGTDADAIQITEGGCITGLLSIPLKYMHSTVEVASLSDIENCGKLIADYIMTLNADKKEGELC